MFVILLFLLFFISLAAIFEDEIADKKIYVFIFLGIILALVCGLRPIGLDNDSKNYEITYTNYDDDLYLLTVEYSFLLISRFLNIFTSDAHAILVLYAFLGVGLKLYGIKKLSPSLFLPLIIYFGNYFLLHEMTQIRAGVACGFFLISLKYLAEGEKKKAMLLWVCATFFHYSSLILFSLLLFSNKTLSRRWKIVLLSIVPISYIFYFANINIITALPLPYIQDKIEIYQDLKDFEGVGEDINVFNLVFLVKILVFVYLLAMYETVYKHNKNLPIMLKIMGLSIASFVMLAPLPVLSFRVSEVFGVVDIILYANIYYTIKPDKLSRLIVVFIGCVLFAVNLFKIELFEF